MAQANGNQEGSIFSLILLFQKIIPLCLHFISKDFSGGRDTILDNSLKTELVLLLKSDCS